MDKPNPWRPTRDPVAARPMKPGEELIHREHLKTLERLAEELRFPGDKEALARWKAVNYAIGRLEKMLRP